VLIENAFTVNAPADDLWSFLLDVERIAPCMPGAELTEVIDERNWKGKVHMKVGPVAMSFAGTVSMEPRDDEAHRVVLRAKGTEQKGKGAADASVTSWLEPGPGADQTTVKMQAEITLVGTAAQMSRGLLPEISKKLTQQFADCLEAAMAAQGAAPAAPPDAGPAERAASAPVAIAPRPVGGIGLALSAICQVIKGFIRRLFGGRG
jgi:carbon monoxide dehydrogenase subunit G